MSESIPGWLRFILLGSAVAAGLAIAVLLLLPDDEPSPYTVPPVMQRPPPSLALAPLASQHVVDDPAAKDYSAVRLAEGVLPHADAPRAAAGIGAPAAQGADAATLSPALQANSPLHARQAVEASTAGASPPAAPTPAAPTPAALMPDAPKPETARQAVAKSSVPAADAPAASHDALQTRSPAPVQRSALAADKPISKPDAKPPAAANPDASDVMRPTFDVVTMSTEGSTVIAGRSLPDADIVVRNGRDDLGHVKADQRGNWVMLPDRHLAAGPQSLTVAERLLDGTEIAGKDHVDFVVPAQPTATLASATGAAARAPGGGDSVATLASVTPGEQVVVKPGENLWRLAKSAYGSGPRYVVIYRANQDKIREPDRIYPGQALDVPSEPVAAGDNVTPASSSRSR